MTALVHEYSNRGEKKTWFLFSRINVQVSVYLYFRFSHRLLVSRSNLVSSVHVNVVIPPHITPSHHYLPLPHMQPYAV